MRAEPTLFKRAGKVLQRTASTILACISIAGVAAMAALAVGATPKAPKCIEWEKGAKDVKNGGNLTRMETTGACWRRYIPAAVTGIATIEYIFSASVLDRHQQASLVGAYALASRSFNRYKQGVKELYGKGVHRKAMSALTVEQSEKRLIYAGTFAATTSLGLEETDEEEQLFYDTISSQYFQAAISQVLQAEYHLNRSFAFSGGFITLSDFYDFLGISKTLEGDKIGRIVSDGLYQVGFDHQRTVVDDGLNGEVECWIIDTPFPSVTYEEQEGMEI